jgi:hypothetical protein
MKDQESLRKEKLKLLFSNFYGLLWIIKLILKGSRKTLEKSDIYAIPENFETENILTSVEVEWNLFLHKKIGLFGILNAAFFQQVYD